MSDTPDPELSALLLDVRHVIRDLRGCTDDDCQEPNCLKVYRRIEQWFAESYPRDK